MRVNAVGNAASGDAAYNAPPVVAPRGVLEPPPRRLRRLHEIWPDRDGNISYLLTICVDGRSGILDNEITFERFVAFLLDSPKRYRWFGRRFVVMPDHIHLIAHAGHDAARLGQWIKALKAVVGGLQPLEPAAASGDAACKTTPHADDIGRLPPGGAIPHQFTRIKRSWRWQPGFHDHKFRTPESEQRKWEYICLESSSKAGLVKRPEERPFGGEIFYDEVGALQLIRGTPPLLENGLLITDVEDSKTTPREGTRPTT